ncbi:MAG: tRNA 5-hydroxyuridine modification protein YegQ [Gammaproteobacteria bacterium]|nr:tRNA 5-hydroxyuridine modification protein YegQ [Gammaproteobacteria bacterium]MCP4091728.1 tRNA 5-hydroxyuridine modification protein YegQ [Gammaproteobacteria bacterium]MCP4275035.1 tRNA 5-hydroxyuridine modification protein YegQ [Gammaproteobacteria bacterium]MCP4831858.1 tRNA 5-hydroxyuridine modification protein YegQ [Gammaproteobacteria bacterium]MCP4929794.1 tRNA 5-hydroxyuridine modification protein YegQ [Gammaproteobacteria bacterium]
MAAELLLPAGRLKSMRYAFAYGADAVYIGQPRYSLRVRENEFSRVEKIAEAVTEAHQAEKLVYIASNISPHNNKVRTYLRDMAPVIEMQPDALIMSDPGLIMMVREKWPDIPVHLSVQANTMNHAAVKFWQSLGLTRIILSRELSLDEIKEIRQECPDIELEVFVHGALCMAYSGRCLLSGYMTHRDSNQGACTNSCRWDYKPTLAEQTPEGDIVPKVVPEEVQVSPSPAAEKLFLLEEKKRPGELMPAWEDEHGTYIMNSKDLRAIQHVHQLLEMGIESLKIEGRTKSYFYVARTTQAYRKAINDSESGQAFDMRLLTELESLANRGYTEGFYRRHLPDEMQQYEDNYSSSDRQQFIGEVFIDDRGKTMVDVKNKFQLNDELELMTPSGNSVFNLEAMLNKEGASIDIAPGSGHIVELPQLPTEATQFGLLMRTINADA